MADIKQVLVRFEADELAAVDRVRGDVPRAAWLRRLCSDAVLAHDVLAGPRAASGEASAGAVASRADLPAPAAGIPLSASHRVSEAQAAVPGMVRAAELVSVEEDGDWPPADRGVV